MKRTRIGALRVYSSRRPEIFSVHSFIARKNKPALAFVIIAGVKCPLKTKEDYDRANLIGLTIYKESNN